MTTPADALASVLEQMSPHGLVDGGAGQATAILAALAAAGFVVVPEFATKEMLAARPGQ